MAAELGGAFGKREGGVYVWVGEAFGKRTGFVAFWLCTAVALVSNHFATKVAKYGFMAGTVVPGLILITLFVAWIATGAGWNEATNQAVATVTDDHPHPRWFPSITGLAASVTTRPLLAVTACGRARALTPCCRHRGTRIQANLTRMASPPSRRGVTVTRASCALAIARTIDNPSPSPCPVRARPSR
ncbi:hypothetical protein HNR40_009568 [Nonomuraea endophytica]|uniref:Amino acid permease n=1 Tax=Nonomuraea endophytica TaxID=714136 RepID=A0A7W8ADF3_9ACTN|nr:hypothetical protein [Nonomuraea endophytica]